MRKFLLLEAFLPIVAVAFGQYYNCNTDPNGEPWIVGDVEKSFYEDLSIPELEL